jgi:hypothetical protein
MCLCLFVDSIITLVLALFLFTRLRKMIKWIGILLLIVALLVGDSVRRFYAPAGVVSSETAADYSDSNGLRPLAFQELGRPGGVAVFTFLCPLASVPLARLWQDSFHRQKARVFFSVSPSFVVHVPNK